MTEPAPLHSIEAIEPILPPLARAAREFVWADIKARWSGRMEDWADWIEKREALRDAMGSYERGLRDEARD